MAKFHDFTLFAHHSFCYGRDLIRDIPRNRLDSMPVSVQQVSRPNIHTPDLHWSSEIVDVSIGMGNRQIPGKHLKLDRASGFDVAHRSVRHHAREPQRSQDIGVDVSDEGAKARMMIQILNDENPGGGVLVRCSSQSSR